MIILEIMSVLINININLEMRMLQNTGMQIVIH